MSEKQPPPDELPPGTTAIDPTGGPQGPYFTTDFHRVDLDHDGLVSWKDICNASPEVWLEDEKRIDYIDMFGSLSTKITEAEMLKYINRLKVDYHGTSKYGRTWKLGEYKQPKQINSLRNSVEISTRKSSRYNIKNFFTDELLVGIQDIFKKTETNYTLSRDMYLRNKFETEIIRYILNYGNINYMSTICNEIAVDNTDIRHLFRFTTSVPAMAEKNTLLTMSIYIPDNHGFMFNDTTVSSTNSVEEQRNLFTYSIYRNARDFTGSYTGETKNNLFSNEDILTSRFDWKNPRVIKHRKNMSYTMRFNKDQGHINYELLSEEQINDLLSDQDQPTTGTMIDKIKLLRKCRQQETINAEKTWNADRQEMYMRNVL